MVSCILRNFPHVLSANTINIFFTFMIQRIQTIYLFLAALLSGLAVALPVPYARAASKLNDFFLLLFWVA